MTRFLLLFCVVFLSVDFPAQLVLLAVDLAALFGAQAAAGLAVVPDLFVEHGFLMFDLRRLFRGELAAFNALADALLLVLLALANGWLLLRRLLGQGDATEQSQTYKSRNCNSRPSIPHCFVLRMNLSASAEYKLAAETKVSGNVRLPCENSGASARQIKHCS